MNDSGANKQKGIDSIFARAMDKCIPLTVLFELTHRCNLRCGHCYVVADDKEPELSAREVKDALRQLSEAGSLFLVLTGGEIFLRDDLFEILAYAKQLKFASRLFTNGTLITEEHVENLAQVRPFDVSVSIYGPTPESHEAITQVEGSFAAATDALSMLNARGITTRMKCVLMKHNINLRDKMVALAEELGATIQFDPLVMPKNNGDQSPLVHRITDDLISFFMKAGFLKECSIDDSAGCGAGREMVSVSPGGEIYPCLQLPLSLGNFRKDKFSILWKESELLRQVRSLRFADITPCRTCDKLMFCNHCPGYDLVDTGSIYRASRINCWMAELRERKSALNIKGVTK